MTIDYEFHSCCISSSQSNALFKNGRQIFKLTNLAIYSKVDFLCFLFHTRLVLFGFLQHRDQIIYYDTSLLL